MRQRMQKQSTKAELATATRSLENLQTQLSYYDAARIASLAGGGNSATTAVVNMPADVNRSEAAMKEIANAVTQAVTQTLELNFSRELCTSILARDATATADVSVKSAVSACYEYLSSSVNLLTGLSARLESSNTRLAAATTGSTSS
jgi:hypothetical protein